jgi:hypothetical protein
MDMEEHMRNQIRQMISQNPQVLIGAGKKKAGRPRKMGRGVVESYSHLLADGEFGDGMHKVRSHRKKNMHGGFAFLAPVLASALAPVAGHIVSKILGRGRTGGGKSGGGKSGGGRSIFSPITNKIVSGLVGLSKGISKSRSGGARLRKMHASGVVEGYEHLLADGMRKKRKSRKGGALSPYQALVKKVCHENGCGVREATQHIKKHKLY